MGHGGVRVLSHATVRSLLAAFARRSPSLWLRSFLVNNKQSHLI